MEEKGLISEGRRGRRGKRRKRRGTKQGVRERLTMILGPPLPLDPPLAMPWAWKEQDRKEDKVSLSGKETAGEGEVRKKTETRRATKRGVWVQGEVMWVD